MGDMKPTPSSVAELTERVAALEKVVTIERRLRRLQETAMRALRTRSSDDDVTTLAPPAAWQDPDRTVLAPPTHSLPDPHSHSLGGTSQPIRAWHGVSGSVRPAHRARTLAPAEIAPLALAAGAELFEYRIDAVLGQGGFGITYLATDVNLDVKVAIKEYLPGALAQRATDRSVLPRWPDDQDAYVQGLESFLVEARTLATFRHPHIVRVARFFEANHTAYMVLEYERGTSLKDWRAAHPDADEQQLLAMLQPLLDGLALVHEAGYLHRDVKPDNIYVRKDDGSLVLLDFGAARQASAGAAAGVVTPGYAPPEQYTDGVQGPWTDIYAVGATLYWLVTGAKPPPAPLRASGEENCVAAVDAGQERFGVDFLAAIDWALAPDPANRPRSMREFNARLFAGHAATLGLQEALRIDEAPGYLPAATRKLKQRAQEVRRGLLHPSSWPIVVKLSLALVVAALLPMVVMAAINLRGSETALSASERLNLQRLAQSTAGRVGQLIHDSGHLAAYLATDQDLVDYLKGATAARQRRVDHMLASMIAVHPDVTHFYLMDARGRIVVASDPELVGVNRGERDYFRSAAAGRAYVSGFVLGYPDRQPVVYYANPVRDDAGRVLGVVVLRIAGQSIAALLDETAAGGTVAPMMVDRDGIVLVIRDPRRRYHSLGPLSEARRARIRAERFDGERLDSLGMPDVAHTLAGARHAGSLGYHSTLTDDEEIAGFAPVPGQDWTVVVSESRKRFEAPLDRLFDNVLRGVALVGLLCLVCGILAARAIVGPVTRLTLAADALKRGDYEGAHVPVTSSDELGRLARTFNIMIDVLRQRERERRRGRRSRKERTETRRT